MVCQAEDCESGVGWLWYLPLWRLQPFWTSVDKWNSACQTRYTCTCYLSYNAPFYFIRLFNEISYASISLFFAASFDGTFTFLEYLKWQTDVWFSNSSFAKCFFLRIDFQSTATTECEASWYRSENGRHNWQKGSGFRCTAVSRTSWSQTARTFVQHQTQGRSNAQVDDQLFVFFFILLRFVHIMSILTFLNQINQNNQNATSHNFYRHFKISGPSCTWHHWIL